MGLAAVAVFITTGTVGASPRLNSVAAAPLPPSVPVNVVNTPLPVSGTVNANITGPIAVSSLPAITGNVTLTNPSVTVNNTATNPVLARDVDDPANNSYLGSVCISATGVQGCTNNALTVPSTTASGQAVKALAIDFLSGTCFTVPGGEIVAAGLDTLAQSTGGPWPHSVVPVVTYSNSTTIDYAFSQETRIHEPPGATLTMGVTYNTFFSATAPPPFLCNMLVDGHLVLQ